VEGSSDVQAKILILLCCSLACLLQLAGWEDKGVGGSSDTHCHTCFCTHCCSCLAGRTGALVALVTRLQRQPSSCLSTWRHLTAWTSSKQWVSMRGVIMCQQELVAWCLV
jgi:hypothetical protein